MLLKITTKNMNYLNRGYGTEALKLWVNHLFANSEYHKLCLDTWSFNPRMMRVAEKVGFIPEGFQRHMQFWEGEWLDFMHFSRHLTPVGRQLFHFWLFSNSQVVGLDHFKAYAEPWKDPDFLRTRFQFKDLRIVFSRSGDVAWYSCFLDDCSSYKGRSLVWNVFQ